MPKSNRGGPRPGAGRPRVAPALERELIEQARSAARASLPAVVALWREGLRHTCDNPKHDCLAYRLSCCRELANRGGLPKELEQRIEHAEAKAAPVMVFDFPNPFPPMPENGDGNGCTR